MTIIEEFNTFKPGTRALALQFLRYGILDGNAPPNIQVQLDAWTRRIEAHGPGARAKVLAKLEGPPA
jgi:hypothetical protein